MQEPGSRANVPAPSGTVTFLFSDIEGSTQRWERDRTAMQDALRVHDLLMRDALVARDGYVFKTVGDAFYAAFATPESVTAAALDAQRALGTTDFSAVDGLRVRMAINTGTADERDGDYFGPALNRVARLLSLGNGGQVLLSGVAADLVRENPPKDSTLSDLGTHVLRDLERAEHVYQLVAPGLLRDFPALRAAVEPPWLVPDAMRTRYFTGRDEQIARLRRHLLERHRAALSGLGGAGKTQTAIEYAARYRSEYSDGVFWVNAETDGGLTGGFVAIAAALRLPSGNSNDRERIVASVLAWLVENDRWLLILDNVDDRREVQPFVPVRGTGDVLITSRESVFAELGIPRTIELRDLEADASVAFLLARTGRSVDSNDRFAAELARELGNLPLALEQAAAYIAQTNASFADYLDAFRKRRTALLEKSGGLISRETIAVTWAANFEAVERASQAAADALRISALLAPEAIPFEIFLDGAQALGDSLSAALVEPDDLTMAEVLRPLARYSLVRSDSESRTFSVHRLVQEIVTAAMPSDERQTCVEQAVRALDAAFPNADFASWPTCERLVAHVMSIAECIRAGAGAAPESAARVFSRAGQYLRQKGRADESRTMHEQALALREGALGPDHPDVSASLNDLANVYLGQGRYDEAQSLYERALAIRERALGHDEAGIARSLNNLALVQCRQGRYAQAQALQERALSMLERALPPGDRDLAHALNALAGTYYVQGRYADAEPLYERALAIRELTLGPNHPEVGSSLNDLAGVRKDQGRHDEAERLLERTLAIWENALGPDHDSVALVLSNLAETSDKQGRVDEAAALYERALATWERAPGPNNPQEAESLTALARLNRKRGRSAEAVALLERALVIRERTLAAGRPELAEVRDELAAARKDER